MNNNQNNDNTDIPETSEQARKIFSLISQGLSLKQIADQLSIPEASLTAIVVDFMYGSRDKTMFASSENKGAIVPLTPLEIKILTLIAQNYSSKQIADKFGFTVFTLKAHQSSIRRKLNARSSRDAVKIAQEYKII